MIQSVFRMSIVKGDISKQEVDAIVVFTNSGLVPKDTLDETIRSAAGPGIFAFFRKSDGCSPSEVKIDPGFNLGAKNVIFIVGPVWQGEDLEEAIVLAECYRQSLDLAIQNGLKTVAFPAISIENGGYPADEAALVAVKAVKTVLSENASIENISFVSRDAETFKALESAFHAELSDELIPCSFESVEDLPPSKCIEIRKYLGYNDALIVMASQSGNGESLFSVPEDCHQTDFKNVSPINIGQIKIVPCSPEIKWVKKHKDISGYYEEELKLQKYTGFFIIAGLPDPDSEEFNLVRLQKILHDALVCAIEQGCRRLGVILPHTQDLISGQILADATIMAALDCKSGGFPPILVNLGYQDIVMERCLIRAYTHLADPDDLPLPCIRYIFKKGFSDFKIVLPEQNVVTRTPGTIFKRTWMIKFRFGKEGEREWCEYYANTRFLSGDTYERIYEDGEVIKFPALGGGMYSDEEYKKLYEGLTREDGILADGPYSGSFLINTGCCLGAGAEKDRKNKGP